MERLLLLDADYTITNSKPIIRLYCSDENGKTTVLLDDSFEPYFYVLPKQGKELEVKKRIENLKRSEIKKVELVERKLLGEKKKFLKITCDLPSNVPKVRDVIKEWEDGAVIEEYEYTLSFYKRYLIDKQLSGIQWIEVDGEEVKGNYQAEKVLKLKKLKVLEDLELPKLKILAFDIETVEEGGKQKIIMLSLVGDSFKKVLTYQKDSYPNYVEVVRDEKELLERFVEVVNEQDVDILLGYNCLPYDEQIILENGNRMSIGEYVKKYEKSEHRPKVIGMVNGYMCPVEVTGVWKYIHPTHHKIIKIRTQTGTELSVTPGNKLPVGTTKGIEWKYAKHVQPSDLIATPRVIKVRVTTPKFIDFIRDDRLVTDRIFIGWVKKCLLKKFGKYRNVAEKLHMNVNTLKNCRGFKIKFLKEHILQILGYEWDEIKEKIKEVDRIKLPEIDKGLMYVAGLVASDGSVSDGNHNRVSFGNTDKRLTDEFKRIVEMKFRKSVEERIIYLHSPKHKDRIQVRVSCSLLRDFLTSLGIPSGNKTKKGVELMRLFTFSEELIGAFIAGLVDGDGNVHAEKQKQRTFYIENKNRKTKSWV
ncbi:MAG: 3'-5' exonuclease, partial [Candidatus Aenigmarchaeota archaeon]|nr:3'-5' exonuclease [Candidatus Aenigmarchaeota archaeon]